MSDTLAGSRLKNVRITGKSLQANLEQACIGGSLSASVESVTELSFQFEDHTNLELFRSGVFTAGQAVRYGHWHGTIETVDVAPGKGRPVISISAPSLFVTRLRAVTGAAAWANYDVTTWVRLQSREAGYNGRIIQPGLGKRTIIREKPDGDKRESSWDVMTKLARELGTWVFEYGDTLVFGKPSWLARRPGRRHITLRWTSWGNYDDALAGMPKFKDAVAAVDQELTVSLVSHDADTLRPGDTLVLAGNVGRMGGTWLVKEVEFPLNTVNPVMLTCARVVDPEPEPPTATSTAKSPSTPTGGSSSSRNNSAQAASSSSAPASTGGAVDRFARANNGQRLDWDGGYGAQCVDLVKKYNETVVGAPVLRGNAKDWYGNPAARAYYTRVGPNARAAKGDIVCWGSSWGGGYGHIGVVLEDRGSSLYVINQLNGRTRYSTLSKRGLQGYLRPKRIR